mmetsp:Transcript_120246/g.345666  ORF Transcript_120246/g.345666 Transcript_120246/m.345666 type:complete len:211 (+) Transcript_120246:99-731(+)
MVERGRPPWAPAQSASSMLQESTSLATPRRGGWTAGWETNPILPASPRWTFGRSNFCTPSFGATTSLRGGTAGSSGAPGALGAEGSSRGRRKHKVRETFIDELLRAEEDQGTGEHLGPGSHDPLPVHRVFARPENGKHGPKASPRRDAGAGGHISQNPRFSNSKSLRHHPQILLPSSHQTPGPGAYTQFTSFGAASGPTRERFLPSVAPQ